MGINSWYLFLNLVELGIIPIDTEVCIHYKISDGHFPTRKYQRTVLVPLHLMQGLWH